MIPRKIYLQYVGDSDEKPTDKDDIRDGDVTWNRERVFKNDIVYYRRVKSNKARFNYSTTLNKKENQTYDRRKFQRKRKRRHTANDQQGETANKFQ